MRTGRRWHPWIVAEGERPIPASPPEIPADPLAALSEEHRARLPNLIGIGAAKCGTSALHAYLSEHPQIGMASKKELKLFGGARWLDGLQDYANRFDADCRVRGETSPTYSMDPYVPAVPEQMAAVLDDPRFIYLVGDPVNRVVAHWHEQRLLTLERRSLREALADAESPVNPYVAASRYGHQLRRYLDVFGVGKVLVVDQEELRHARAATLRQVFAFAGVDVDHWSPVYEAEPNAASHRLLPNALGRWVISRTRLSRRVRARAIVPVITAARTARPALDDATRRRLAAVLRPDIERFRELTGRSFENWTI